MPFATRQGVVGAGDVWSDKNVGADVVISAHTGVWEDDALTNCDAGFNPDAIKDKALVPEGFDIFHIQDSDCYKLDSGLIYDSWFVSCESTAAPSPNSSSHLATASAG